MTKDELRAFARQMADKYGIPADLFDRQMGQESQYGKYRQSEAGAIGPMQLLPDTARDLGVDPYNDEQNVEGGARYLNQQFKQFGSWPLALAAYNAGPGNIMRGRFPAETRDYVRRIAGTTFPGTPATVEDMATAPLQSQMMLNAILQRIQKGIYSQESPEAAQERERLMTDYGQMGQELQQSDQGLREEIAQTPTQSTRPGWQQAAAALLGGGSQAGIENEVKQAQQQHKDALAISLQHNQRLAAAYEKLGDMVNAAKYSRLAASDAEKSRKQFETDVLAAKEAGLNERAAMTAGPRTKPPVLTRADYQKQINATIGQFMDKKSGKIPDEALPLLKASLVLLRHDEQTPLDWARELFGMMPAKKGAGPFGIFGGGRKAMFDPRNKADWALLQNAGHIFTPDELANEQTGEPALKMLMDQSLSAPAPAPAEPAQPEQPQAEPPVVLLRREAADLTKQVADLRQSKELAPEQQQARMEQLKAVVARLHVIKKVLTLMGQTMPGMQPAESKAQ